MSDSLPPPPQNPIPPIKPIPPQKNKEQITEGDKAKTAPKQYEYSHTISHWGVFSKWLAGVASKSDTRKITPTLGQMILISYIVGILLSILECFLNPEMWYSISILCIPFSILWIFKYLPLAVRRVHAFGKSYLWVFGITPFLIVLVTSLPILLTVGDAIRYTGSENVEALLGKAVVSLILFVIGQIITSIYYLYWVIKIVFKDAPVDIDERERKHSNILCGKSQISKIQLSNKSNCQTPSDKSERLFKTTAGKWIFAASVVLCSIPLIYQFTPRQIVVQDSHFQSDKEKENENSVQLQKTEEENNSLLTNDDSERTPKINNPFVKAGTDINKTDGKVQTRLYRAALEGQTEVVKLLIAAGADVNKANNDGLTPLHAAALEGQTEVVKLLIEAGADVNNMSENAMGFTPLHLAAVEGQTEVVKLLIAAGADVNKAAKDGETPLFVAALYGQTELAKLLIEVGADVNKANNDVWTPLHAAAVEGPTELVKLLIEVGADVNKADNNDLTPLHFASEIGHTEIVKLLIEKGADVNKADKDGDTPLRCAIMQGNTEIVELLKAAGAKE